MTDFVELMESLGIAVHPQACGGQCSDCRPLVELIAKKIADHIDSEIVEDLRLGHCRRFIGRIRCLNYKSAGIHLPADRCPDGADCDHPEFHHDFLGEGVNN